MEILPQFTNISKPLGLAGLALAVLFFLFRRILKLGIFPKLAREHNRDVLLRIINYLFVLALVAMVLGFAVHFFTPQVDLPVSDEIARRKVTIRAHGEDLSQGADLREVLMSFANQVGVRPALHRDVKGTIHLQVDNSELRDVMGEICRIKNCTWKIQEGNPPALLVLPNDAPVRP